MNHKNYPHMRLTDVSRMTTCIPIVFKPIEFNGDLYVDGGISGSIPYIHSKRYQHNLIVCIYEKIEIQKTDSITDYSRKLLSIVSGMCDRKLMKKQKTIIGIDFNINTLDFLLSIDTKKRVSHKAYEITNSYIKNLQQRT
jgi:predicted patatin/cPLA2 family phospholipase